MQRVRARRPARPRPRPARRVGGLPRRADRRRGRARRRPVRLRPRAAPVDAARHRDAARAGGDGRGRARARRAGRRARGVERPARPRLRGGEHRQLRLEPRHQRAALGRPADGALRLHGARPTSRTSTRSRSACTRTTAPRRRRRSTARSSRCGDYEADYRVVHPDGTVRWVAARGRVLADQDGRPARMLGAAYDTTDVHSAAERLGRVLETMSTAFFTLDRDWRFTYVNAAAERMLGRRAATSSATSSGRSTTTSTGRRAASTTAPRWRPASRAASSSSTRRWTRTSTSASTPERRRHQRLLPRHHRARARRAASARRRSSRPARRPAACRSSARPAPGWRGRSTSTSCCASSATSSSTASAKGSWSRSTRSAALARRPDRPPGRRPSTERAGALVGEPLEVDRFGTRTGVLGELVDAPGGLEHVPAMALPLISRGRTLGAVVVIGRGRERARPARAGGARRARGRRARQRGALRRRAAARADPAAVAAADGAAEARPGSSSPRATSRASAGRTSAATSTSATRSTTAACC